MLNYLNKNAIKLRLPWNGNYSCILDINFNSIQRPFNLNCLHEQPISLKKKMKEIPFFPGHLKKKNKITIQEINWKNNSAQHIIHRTSKLNLDLSLFRKLLSI